MKASELNTLTVPQRNKRVFIGCLLYCFLANNLAYEHSILALELKVNLFLVKRLICCACKS